MNDKELIQEVAQTTKKLDDVKAEAFLVFMRTLSTGFSTRQAVEISNVILIKAGREPVPPELFAQ